MPGFERLKALIAIKNAVCTALTPGESKHREKINRLKRSAKVRELHIKYWAVPDACSNRDKRKQQGILKEGDYIFNPGISIFIPGNNIFILGNDIFSLGNDIFSLGNDIFSLGNAIFILGNAIFILGNAIFILGNAIFSSHGYKSKK